MYNSFYSDDYYDEHDALCHFGVKGMHWGIRRTPKQLGHHSNSTQKQLEAKAKEATVRYAKTLATLKDPKAKNPTGYEIEDAVKSKLNYDNQLGMLKAQRETPKNSFAATTNAYKANMANAISVLNEVVPECKKKGIHTGLEDMLDSYNRMQAGGYSDFINTFMTNSPRPTRRNIKSAQHDIASMMPPGVNIPGFRR